MAAYATRGERILAARSVDSGAVNEDLGLSGGINGGHNDMGREGLTGVKSGLFGDNEGVEPVHPNILQVDIGHQGMENLALRSEEHTSELQSRQYLVCRLLLEKKKNTNLCSR